MGFCTFVCLSVCLYTLSTYVHQKIIIIEVCASECLKCSCPFYEKSNVFHRNEKCDDGHLTSLTDIMVHGNSEKRNSNTILLEKVTISFSPGDPRFFSLCVLPPAVVTQVTCSNIQGSSKEMCFSEHTDCGETLEEVLICPLGAHGRNPAYICSDALKSYLKWYLMYFLHIRMKCILFLI